MDAEDAAAAATGAADVSSEEVAAAEQTRRPEDRLVGKVAPEVVLRWVRAAGLQSLPLAALAILVTEAFSVGSSWWLTRWGASAAKNSLRYLAGYVALALVTPALIVLRSITTLTIGLRAGGRLHDQLLAAVVRAPMAFFDVTPLGRRSTATPPG